ncbi:sulfatase-like hydrolase/transferase [Autumnicola musiva]|uniref:Sulfatase-like hydrolase/transferase n=1 Tax=Autumnicola musiva TaxID=3075589 RepID=A0ABU3DAX2_9FLAO|nr:sulfatase-like hydrolase/transferase [Zunongwangia sp. F117]MDT0678500.1 sulfatase-like hydrolase/transferase [Zunongwangia sp. F117]
MRKQAKRNKRLLWLCALLFTYGADYVKAQNIDNNTKPNVIIINVDDLGYGDTGVYGATKVKTPNIDKLAGEGRRFTDFHSASAVCSPSRYALITGEYPARKDLWSPIFLRTSLVIDTTQMTVGKVMKNAGYSTGIIGKWHLGFGNETPIDWNKELKPGPLELGFDYYFGVPVLNSHPPFVYVENHKVVGLTPNDPMVYGTHAETRWFPEKFGLEEIGGGRSAHQLYDDRMVGTTLKDKAIGYIKENKDHPFFLYFATTNIHHPFTPAPRFIGTSEAGRYGDFIHELDWMVGEVMKTLDDEGLADNTLLILTSDNGGMLNQGGQHAYELGHHQNGELLGFKFDAWEGGHRVPLIIRWPDKVPAGTVSDEILSNVDFLATLAALVNYDLKKEEGPDSYNMLPAFMGASSKPIRNKLLISPSSKNHISVRKGKWMFIDGQGGGGFAAQKVGAHAFGGAAAFPFTGQENSDIENGIIKDNAPPAQLYDLEKDPYESINVYEKYPKVVKEMKMLIKEILESSGNLNSK